MRWRKSDAKVFRWSTELLNSLCEFLVNEVPDTLLPRSPGQLLAQIFAIFPGYQDAYRGPIHDDAPTFHSTLIGFTGFFGGGLKGFSETQLRSFGALINQAVDAGGDLENAFSTCLLEHLRQIRAEKAMKPFLSKAARMRLRA